MEATAGGASDFWSLHSRGHLCEASLRLLAALGSGTRFPTDIEGIQELIGRVAEGRPGEVMEFAVEPAGELPRYTGRYRVWVSPAEDDCLRLRHEWGGLSSEAATVRPDGWIEGFESIEGFGVPDSELTEQAVADREAVERLNREREVEEVEIDRQVDEEQQRFRTEHLLGTRAAPPQDQGGPIVTFVVLYATGVIVHYLVPRPPDEELETDDPWAEPLMDATFPEINLSDGCGTVFESVGLSDQGGAEGELLRASQSFVPAIPDEAERLWIEIESRRVEVEVRRSRTGTWAPSPRRNARKRKRTS